jgi:hypothetical protein
MRIHKSKPEGEKIRHTLFGTPMAAEKKLGETLGVSIVCQKRPGTHIEEKARDPYQ